MSVRGGFTGIFEAIRPLGQDQHFFALVAYAPPEISQELDDIRRRYDPAIKEGILPHVTIKRPASLPDPTVLSQLTSAIQEAVQTVPPFQVELAGYGIFTNPGKNVVFLKVQDESPFCQLHLNVISGIEKVLPGGGKDQYEGQAYHPHLTIGNSLDDLELVVMRHELDTGSYRLNFSFQLSEITLLHQPPRQTWRTVAKFDFKGTQS